ncbi:hypothetical protein SASPL_143786 [Salvia splendens]|uniref:Uncharacterized protein n=1 Tax=Salvia splendens TaxID=180675 RepID=A0A8X8ZAB5_SALSN|nr:hypothetical protein SASPL_143786 [Salvia splendens]
MNKKLNLARKNLQAYTNELELEVAHLLEENAKLRKQQEKVCVCVCVNFYTLVVRYFLLKMACFATKSHCPVLVHSCFMTPTIKQETSLFQSLFDIFNCPSIEGKTDDSIQSFIHLFVSISCQFYREAAAEHQKRKPLHRTSTAPF